MPNSPAPRYLTSPPATDAMPPGIPFIVGNEAAERFSYYGMRAILAVFLTKHLCDVTGKLAPMDDATSNVWQHNFAAAVYFLPLAGAVLSDWLWGKYHTILRLSLVYCLGHVAMALVDLPQTTGVAPRTMLMIALGLIAIGSGGIKPCVSAHVGDQFGPRNAHLLTKVFGWFYFAINLGAAASTLLTPILLDPNAFRETFGRAAGWMMGAGIRPGPSLAFGVPGVLMALATLVFWLGRNRFVHIPPGGLATFRDALEGDGRRALVNLTPLFFLLAPFWSLIEQTQSQWVHQADHMNCLVWGREILPSQMQAFNPVLVMIYIPLFSYALFPLLGRLVALTPFRKIGLGFVIAAAAFAVVAVAQRRIDAGERPHISWQIVAYVLITAAEVMIYWTALEFSYTQAPKRMKSIIMSVLMLSISLGNFIVAGVNEFISSAKEQGRTVLAGASYYWFFVALMLATLAVFVVWSKTYRGSTFIQGDETA